MDFQRFTCGSSQQAATLFGNGFCLLQFTGRGYDEIATRAAGAS